MTIIEGQNLVHSGLGSSESSPSPLLKTSVPLSFWGGIDPITGRVVDVSHPLYDECVTEKILCLPSGRGSCTASQVLLELILNGKAPKAIILRDVDGLVCVGALIAQRVFGKTVPDIVALGQDNFGSVLNGEAQLGIVKGRYLVTGNSDVEIQGCVDLVPDEESSQFEFTREEIDMLSSTTNEAEKMAMEVIFQYGHIVSSDPPRYIDIVRGHIDGCTYIGPGGLEFTRKLVRAGGKVKVPTTLNSVSADRKRWQQYQVPEEYAKNSIALGDAYLELGCEPSFTCAPYLLKDPPKLGEDICWGESNAVVFANSVLGARTEKYADYLDICAALVGKTVATGVHLDENRKPKIILDATELLPQLNPFDDSLFPTLGHTCGTLSDGAVPILLGMENWDVSRDNLKAFCAAYGTTGTSPLIHIAGKTPEVTDDNIIEDFTKNLPVRKVSMDDLLETYETLDSSNEESIDLVALGNPHLSIEECATLSNLVDGSSKHDSVRIMACISRALYSEAAEHVTRLESFGVEFVSDTCWCMLLDPPIIPATQGATILTNSGKYAHYGPGLTKRNFRFGSMQDCVSAAITGKYTPGSARLRPRMQERTFSSAARHAVFRAIRYIAK